MQDGMLMAPPRDVVVPIPLSGAGAPLRAPRIVLPSSTPPTARPAQFAQSARRRATRTSFAPLTVPMLVGGAMLLIVYVLLAIVVFLLCIVLRDLAHAAIHFLRPAATTRAAAKR